MACDLNDLFRDGGVSQDQDPFIAAVKLDNVEEISKLYDSNMNLNEPHSETELTPMQEAVRCGSKGAINKLKELGADPNGSGQLLLHVAVENRHDDNGTIELLESIGVEIDQVDNIGRTPLYIAAANGDIETVKLLKNLCADVNKARYNNGQTPIFIAAENGQAKTVELLAEVGAEVNKSNKYGETPLSKAIQKKHKRIVEILQRHGAKFSTEDMDIKTVDHVKEFFKQLNIDPGTGLDTLLDTIENKKIDKEYLFSISDAGRMSKELDVGHDFWGDIYFQIVQHHKALQEDRADTKDAPMRAKEALSKMDNQDARIRLSAKQQEIVSKMLHMTMPCQVNGTTTPKKLKAETVKEMLSPVLEEISDIAKKEQERLGKDVTATCREKYEALHGRWAAIRDLPSNIDNFHDSQPVANTSWGILRDGSDQESDSNPMGSSKEPIDARIQHLLFIAKASYSHFRSQIEKIVSAVNEAKHPLDLGLDVEKFLLPFVDTKEMLVEGKRARLKLGPLKSADRAAAKAKEYEEEMVKGEKKCEVASLPISPADYILDFVRATVEVEDPYLVGVLFSVIANETYSKYLRLCRIKNKFMDEAIDEETRTNVLLNLDLLYPETREDFEASGMLGEFQETLKTKKILHKYYDITRTKSFEELGALLLKKGPFVDPNSMAAVNPQVVKEIKDIKEPALTKEEALGKTLAKKEEEIDRLRKENDELKTKLEMYSKSHTARRKVVPVIDATD